MKYTVRNTVENSLLYRPHDHRRTKELIAFLLAAIPPLAVLFWAAQAKLSTLQTGYQIGRLEAQRTLLLEKRRQLEVEKARASELKRIEAIAKQKLGLQSPLPEQVILVKQPGPSGDGAKPMPLPQTAQTGTQPPLATTPGPEVPDTEEGF